MPRAARGMQVVGKQAEPVGVHVPGVYAALLAQERKLDGRPDPRYATVAKLPPPRRQVRERSQLLPDLLVGRPVVVPRWRLGGSSIPVPQVDMFRDSTFTAWCVTADDRVSPGATAGR